MEHFLLTLTIAILSATVAITVPDILNAIGFVGGTCFIFITVVFPLWMEIKLSKEEWYSIRNLFIILVGGIMFCVA
jgi:amino acid permease